MQLAEGLELELIVEGVETSEERAALTALGVDHAQGYLFSRPVDENIAPSLLAGTDVPVVPSAPRAERQAKFTGVHP